MSTLDNLINKITGDSEERAREITGEAREKAEAAVASGRREAERITREAAPEIEREAAALGVRNLADKRLELRDRQITAKRESIQRVLDEALKTLNAMPEEAFAAYTARRIMEYMPEGAAEIILPPQYPNINAATLTKAVKKLGGGTELAPCRGGRRITGGFVLVTGGVERNETFEAALEYNRDALEAEIIQHLF